MKKLSVALLAVLIAGNTAHPLQISAQQKVLSEPTVISAPVKANYKLATDSDFTGDSNADFRYIGTSEYVIIPEIIKGVKVTSYNSLFENTAVKGVLSDNPNIDDFGYMFLNNSSETLEFDLKTNNAINTAGMFEATKAKELDLNNLNTVSVQYMQGMFRNSSAKHLNLSKIDTKNAKDMSSMFEGSQAETIKLKGIEVFQADYLLWMFKDSTAKTLDLSTFNLYNLSEVDLGKLNYMFEGSQATKGWARTVSDAKKLNASLGKPAGLTFYVLPWGLDPETTPIPTTPTEPTPQAPAPQENKGTPPATPRKDAIPVIPEQPKANPIAPTTPAPQSNPVTNIDDYKTVTDEDFLGSADGDFAYIGTEPYVIIPHKIKGIPVTSYKSMFAHSNVKGVLSENPNITNMDAMFYEHKSETLELNLNTSKVKYMTDMFAYSLAKDLILTSFDTSNVETFENMFLAAQATTIDVSTFDTTKAKSMINMFQLTQATDLNLAHFNTSNVDSFIGMFAGSSAKVLDLRNFDTSKAKSLSGMFTQSKAVTIDISNFDYTNHPDISWMFHGSSVLSVDFSNLLVLANKQIKVNSLTYGSSIKTIYINKLQDPNLFIKYAHPDAGTNLIVK